MQLPFDKTKSEDVVGSSSKKIKHGLSLQTIQFLAYDVTFEFFSVSVNLSII